jgi:hypothetical protein
MKGLELSEGYYQAHGRPMIVERFGNYAERIATGLVGDGSECFGFDDEISRDHDWGPGFCMWLVLSDHETISESLCEAMAELPRTFAGYGPRKPSDWGQGRVGVFEIVHFYRAFTGLDHVPGGLGEWLRLPESYLAACTNGKVFHDPLGEFTRWREKLLEFYPEDVRLKKIASRCMTIAQFGQYNFERCRKREEHWALKYAETMFCRDAISLAFLLNRRYCPFFKWMHRALKALPILGLWLHSRISQLVTMTSLDAKVAMIEEICGKLINELRSQSLSDSSSTFLLDHGPIVQNHIKDEAMRRTNVWVG